MKTTAQETRVKRTNRYKIYRALTRYLSLAVVVFASAIVASAQTQIITDGTNYGLHFVSYGTAIQVTMEDSRIVTADPPSEFTIIVDWYGVAADGSVLPQRTRQDIQRFSVQPGAAASWRFVERSRAGEYAGIRVLLNYTVDPPDPDITVDPPDPDVPQLSPSASVLLVNTEKSLIGLLLPVVEKIRKTGGLEQ